MGIRVLETKDLGKPGGLLAGRIGLAAEAISPKLPMMTHAVATFVTQPALSLAVKKLEQELGVAIFERKSPHISLTPLGEQIVQQAQQVLEGAAMIKALASQGENQLRGVLRLGVIATVGPY